MKRTREDVSPSPQPIEIPINEEARGIAVDIEEPISPVQLPIVMIATPPVPPSKKVKTKRVLSQRELEQRKNAAKARSAKAAERRRQKLKEERGWVEGFVGDFKSMKTEFDTMKSKWEATQALLEQAELKKQQRKELKLKRELEERERKAKEDKEKAEREEAKRIYEFNQWKKKKEEEDAKIKAEYERERQLSQTPNWEALPVKGLSIPMKRDTPGRVFGARII